MATACSARHATSVRLAPARSANRPQTMRPDSAARPAAPSTVAAVSGATPQSAAYATMWKIGPEWAAQHAKFASARLQNTGVFSAPATVMPAGEAPAANGTPADRASATGAGRNSSAAGRMIAQAMNPSVSMAKRQSCVTISQRASGAIRVVPSARPADTSDTARLRWRVNQLAVAAVNGTYTAPAARPTAVP